MRRLRLRLRGQVQGVGLRPWLAREARARGLSGAVWNDADGVGVEIQGTEADLDGLLTALDEAPPPIRVQGCAIERRPPVSERGFQIRESQLAGPPRPALAPDQALCEPCAAEILDPGNRRYRYAFTTCATCGPRYALVEALPFDRARTGMAGFPMCGACASEHADPEDRRYHAVTLSCPACGPRLRWQGPDGAVTDGYSAVLSATEALRAGLIVAVLGLGGYQLLCDARSEAAVARLRARKRRPDKPLAVLVRDAEAAAELARLDADARALWDGPIAPIVVAPLLDGAALAPSVLRGLGEVGLMRPTTALHLLLADGFGGPLICTSGNRAGDPLATTAAQARQAMGEVPDGWLEHDRPVTHPVDDSVLRARCGRRIWLRRARGLAPSELAVPEGPTVLALGAHLKSTVTLAHRDGAWVSPSLGELGSEAAETRLREAAAELCNWHGVRPELVTCDAHPDYASTRLAEAMAVELGVPLLRVQHHHAHAAAVLAEAGHRGPASALCWDGAGWGPDGTVWGGEWLEIEPGHATRWGQLRPFALPGGDRAAREPARVSLALLHTLQYDSFDGFAAHLVRVREALGPGRADALQAALTAGVGAPQTSSAGRLFDGLAHLLGGPPAITWEAQAACWLEQLAGEVEAAPLPPPAPRPRDGIVELDWAPWLRDLLRATADRAALAAAVHVGLAQGAAAMLQRSNSPRVVALAGGCFQNLRLLRETTTALSAVGITTLHARDLPPNDEAISFGQAMIARQRALR